MLPKRSRRRRSARRSNRSVGGRDGAHADPREVPPRGVQVAAPVVGLMAGERVSEATMASVVVAAWARQEAAGPALVPEPDEEAERVPSAVSVSAVPPTAVRPNRRVRAESRSGPRRRCEGCRAPRRSLAPHELPPFRALVASRIVPPIWDLCRSHLLAHGSTLPRRRALRRGRAKRRAAVRPPLGSQQHRVPVLRSCQSGARGRNVRSTRL